MQLDHLIPLPEGYDERTRIAFCGDSILIAHPEHPPYCFRNGRWVRVDFLTVPDPEKRHA